MTILTPLSDKIIVRPFEDSLTTAGGLILLSSQEDPDAPRKGTVISVGPGRAGEEMTLKPGDNVLFNPHAGLTLTVDGLQVILMRQVDALVKFTEVDAAAN